MALIDSEFSERRRLQVKAAMARWRERAKAGKRIYRLSLCEDVVAAALLIAERGAGQDTADHTVCEELLTRWVEELVWGVIDNLRNDSVMAEIVRDLKGSPRCPIA